MEKHESSDNYKAFFKTLTEEELLAGRRSLAEGSIATLLGDTQSLVIDCKRPETFDLMFGAYQGGQANGRDPQYLQTSTAL